MAQVLERDSKIWEAINKADQILRDAGLSLFIDKSRGHDDLAVQVDSKEELALRFQDDTGQGTDQFPLFIDMNLVKID